MRRGPALRLAIEPAVVRLDCASLGLECVVVREFFRPGMRVPDPPSWRTGEIVGTRFIFWEERKRREQRQRPRENLRAVQDFIQQMFVHSTAGAGSYEYHDASGSALRLILEGVRSLNRRSAERRRPD